jgi:DNA ligase-1
MNPLLLPREKPDLEKLPYPLLMSPKLDGMRCLTTGQGGLTRSKKPVANKHIQEGLKKLPAFLDGELMAGTEPTGQEIFSKTMKLCRSHTKVGEWSYWLFDRFADPDTPFHRRLSELRKLAKDVPSLGLRILPQYKVNNPGEVCVYEEEFLAQGYEGGVLRNPHKKYKHGRATLNEEIGWKLKQFVDGEALVVGMSPLMHNENDAFVSETGHQKRSKVATGLRASKSLMGTLHCRDIETDVFFDLGSGFTAAQREWWFKPHNWKNKIIVYKKFAHGEKDKPRHPIFKGIRDALDL